MDEQLEKIVRANKKRLWIITGAAIGGNIIMIVSFIYYSGVKNENINSRIFKSPEERALVVNHVNNAPDPVILDAMVRHTTAAGVHMPKEVKDSVYVPRAEWVEWIKNNAYDTYQMKRNTDKTLQEVTEVKKVMNIVIDKLNHIETRR